METNHTHKGFLYPARLWMDFSQALHDLCLINVSTTSMLTSINAAALGLAEGLRGNAFESKDPRVCLVKPNCKCIFFISTSKTSLTLTSCRPHCLLSISSLVMTQTMSSLVHTTAFVQLSSIDPKN